MYLASRNQNNSQLKTNKMQTIESNKTRIIKTIEIKRSNMSFIVTAHCHYMAALQNPGWSAIRFSAEIKETGENIGGVGGKSLIKKQIELINSKPELFLTKIL